MSKCFHSAFRRDGFATFAFLFGFLFMFCDFCNFSFRHFKRCDSKLSSSSSVQHSFFITDITSVPFSWIFLQIALYSSACMKSLVSVFLSCKVYQSSHSFYSNKERTSSRKGTLHSARFVFVTIFRNAWYKALSRYQRNAAPFSRSSTQQYQYSSFNSATCPCSQN